MYHGKHKFLLLVAIAIVTVQSVILFCKAGVKNKCWFRYKTFITCPWCDGVETCIGIGLQGALKLLSRPPNPGQKVQFSPLSVALLACKSTCHNIKEFPCKYYSDLVHCYIVARMIWVFVKLLLTGPRQKTGVILVFRYAFPLFLLTLVTMVFWFELWSVFVEGGKCVVLN